MDFRVSLFLSAEPQTRKISQGQRYRLLTVAHNIKILGRTGAQKASLSPSSPRSCERGIQHWQHLWPANIWLSWRHLRPKVRVRQGAHSLHYRHDTCNQFAKRHPNAHVEDGLDLLLQTPNGCGNWRGLPYVSVNCVREISFENTWKIAGVDFL